MTTPSQEALWVLRAQCGDEEALAQLLGWIQPSLRRYLRGVVGATDADDVTQEVLLIIYRKLRWLHAPELFRAWAFRITSRAAFRHIATRQRRREHLEECGDLVEFAAAPRPPDTCIEELLRANRVSPACSAVLTLHFQEGMSLVDVAAVLELPLGTVKSRLAYGLAKLRQMLGERKDDDG